MILAVGLSAIAVSNRVRRRFRRAAARLFCLGWAERRAQRLGVSAALERATSIGELLRMLPKLVCEAADVEPVTVFLLDCTHDSYVPVSSTLFPVPSDAIAADEPLPRMLRRVRCVHLLHGRTDDLENAPISAVNARPLQSCRAVCAVPLFDGRTLFGLLLCGGTTGRGRLGLRGLACLERLTPRLVASLERFSQTELPSLAGESGKPSDSWTGTGRTTGGQSGGRSVIPAADGSESGGQAGAIPAHSRPQGESEGNY